MRAQLRLGALALDPATTPRIEDRCGDFSVAALFDTTNLKEAGLVLPR